MCLVILFLNIMYRGTIASEAKANITQRKIMFVDINVEIEFDIILFILLVLLNKYSTSFQKFNDIIVF
jgi:hypothetical protein